jgi:hypothetical protein
LLIFLDAIRAAIRAASPHIFAIDLSLTEDIPIASNHVPVMGTVTCGGIIYRPRNGALEP